MILARLCSEDKSSVTGKDKPLTGLEKSFGETCFYRLPGNLLPGETAVA
jgi:hypothetical protein